MTKTQFLFLILFFPLIGFAQNVESYFFVFLNSNPNKEQLDSVSIAQLQEKHLANINRLYEEGKIIAAGPFYDGGGIFIFKESAIENVQKILQTDAAIAANRFLIELFPLRILKGQVCPYTEPLEMITLSFIRVFRQNSESTEKMISNLDKKWNNEVLTSAVFEEDLGGFMVLTTDFEKLNQQMQSVEKDSEQSLSIRQLYIAKGTFCQAPKK